jgi:flavin reductase (DIM6/NTAB) family NADH-FMN oxidoreductase RutF
VSGAHGGVVGPVPAGRDPQAYDRLRRRVLWSLPSGLYLMGSRAGERRNLMTISWVVQVATDPKMVAAGVEASSWTHELLEGGGTFALSLLARSQRAVVRRFVKPVHDVSIDEEAGTGTMNGEPVRLAPGGEPVLAAAVAWLWCTVRERLTLGSHSLFVAEVADCGVGAPGERQEAEGEPEVDGEVLRMEDTRMHYGG